MSDKKISELTSYTPATNTDVFVIVDTTTSTTKKISWANIKSFFATAAQGSNSANHIASTSNPHSVTATQVGLGNADNTSDTNKPVSSAQQTALNLKENTANKDTTMSGNTTSNVKFLTAKAIYDWATGLFALISSIPTSLSQLSDDSTHRLVTDSEISTWNAKQSAFGYTPENVSNKSTNIVTDLASDTKYPSVKAIYDWVTANFGSGAGDMILSSVQTVSGAKTFLDGKFILRNVANTFNAIFTNTNTADRTYTLPNKDGTVAMTSDITGTNSGTNTGDQDISGKENISNKSTDTNLGTSDTLYPSQKAVKLYVDALAQGLSPKPSALIATTTTLPTYTYNNGSSGVGATITSVATGIVTVDGHDLALNDVILVKNETAGNVPYNGLYVVTVAGAIGVALILTRHTSMDLTSEFSGGYVFIETGTVNVSAGFVCTNIGNITVGTTNVAFTQFSGAGEIIAGNGISKSVNTLSIDTSVVVDKTTGQTLSNKTFSGNTIFTGGYDLFGSDIISIGDLMNVNTTVIASYTASRSGTTVTASVGTFTTADIGRVIYWATNDTYDRITAYISSTQVTVDHSGTIASQSASTFGPPTFYIDNINNVLSLGVLPVGAGVSNSTTASTLVARDANANAFNNNMIVSSTSTATAAGTTTLTAASTNIQRFTGTTTQNVVLPATNAAGISGAFPFEIHNDSTGTVTIQDSSTAVIATITNGQRCKLSVQTAGSPGVWNIDIPGNVSTGNTWSKAQIGGVTALSVSANAIATDLSLDNNFSVTLQATTSQVLSNPTNMVAGQSGQIAIAQNATPSTLTYDSYWIPFDGTTPSVSTTASAQNLITYYVVDSTHVWFVLNKHGVA